MSLKSFNCFDIKVTIVWVHLLEELCGNFNV